MKYIISSLITVLILFSSATVVYAVTYVSYYLTATNFGFAVPADATINGIKVEVEQKKSGGDPYVDHVRITVYYTEAPETRKSVVMTSGKINITNGKMIIQ